MNAKIEQMQIVPYYNVREESTEDLGLKSV